jgi:Trypsin-co-occurring domain 2
MNDDVGKIGLEETIAALRQELIASIIASQGEGLRFEVGEVIVEFHVEVERNTDAKGGIKFWVVELGGGGGQKDKSTHKVTIPLKPIRRDGKPVLTGSNEVPI